MYDDEYKERAYEWWTLQKDTGIHNISLFPISYVLNTDCFDLEKEFKARYKAEQDDIDNILNDVDNFCRENFPEKKWIEAEECLYKLVDRTIEVTKRDNNV